MKCRICGSKMASIITDLPFKVSRKSIVIVKDVPVFQCNGCSEYLLGDVVMEEIENILEKVDAATELEVLKYAA
jgi:YgiT-type zinc finger domain-containing protein